MPNRHSKRVIPPFFRGADLSGHQTLLFGLAGLSTAKTEITAVKAEVVIGKDGATINFGKVENQISHTFRHIDAVGIDRKLVQEAIKKDLSKFSSSMPEGLYSSSVNVNGVKIDFNAFKLSDGSINIVRITPPRS